MGVALTNFGLSAGPVLLEAFDADGTLVDQTTFTMAAFGHTAFVLQDRMPETRNRRGHVRITNNVPAMSFVTAIGLRFAPNGGPFTTIFAVDHALLAAF